jgi:hypothetical protein
MSAARSPDDIPPRFEQKFLLTMAQAEAVRATIAPFCVLDPNSAASPTKRYLVTTLYLDTPHLAFHRAWELTAPNRFKLRIRRYGEKLGDSPVFVEVKERVQDITVKRRTIMKPDDWLSRCRDGGGQSRAERDYCARRDRYRAQPTLLVRYEREAWKGVLEAYARVTFDSHLQFQRTDRWSLEGDGGAWLPVDDPLAVGEEDPRILLELKFEREIPRWMVGLMRNLELVRRGFSKYGVGVRRAFEPDERLDVQKRESAVTRAF